MCPVKIISVIIQAYITIFSFQELLMEIMKNIHVLRTKAPGIRSGTINAYLFKSSQGSLLIDTGWNEKKAEEMLIEQLHEAGVNLDDLHMIVVTHTHPDHFGMVHRLALKTGAQLVIHEKEQAELVRRAENYETMVEEMTAWLEAHDMPGDPRRSSIRLPWPSLDCYL